MKDHIKPLVGISLGDINGIGPEIILKTFLDSRVFDSCSAVVFGSIEVLEAYKKILHLPDVSLNKIKNLKEIKKNKLNVMDTTGGQVELKIGQSTDEAGAMSLSALEAGVEASIKKEIDILLTSPINKSNVEKHESEFRGHTGYLAEKDESEALMILFSEKMKIAMVTGHVALKDVADAITPELIISKIEALQKSLVKDFGILKPKIAVLGLNPHAGESGVLGKEEELVILPAIKQVKTKGILAFGPYPSDGFFGANSYEEFDGILAMYHDQALIPFKTLSFEQGVNYTAGLSFVRTSPDHGTAYEIAGKREASEQSFRTALFAGCDIFLQRREKEIEGEQESV